MCVCPPWLINLSILMSGYVVVFVHVCGRASECEGLNARVCARVCAVVRLCVFVYVRGCGGGCLDVSEGYFVINTPLLLFSI